MLKQQAAAIVQLETAKAALEGEVVALKADRDKHNTDLAALDARLTKLEPTT
jgi:hypothetical protein